VLLIFYLILPLFNFVLTLRLFKIITYTYVLILKCRPSACTSNNPSGSDEYTTTDRLQLRALIPYNNGWSVSRRDEVASPVRVSAAVVSSVTTLESALLPPRIRRFRTPAAPSSTVILAVEQCPGVLACTRVMLRAE
jgi:hypothetical protein